MPDKPDTGTAATKDLMDRALAHHRAGRPERAEPLYRNILAAEPDNPDALHLLGLAAREGGRHDEALALIEQAVSVAPGNGGYLNSGGAVMLDLGRPEDAADWFAKAAAAGPRDRGARENLIKALTALGRHVEAEFVLDQLVRLEPEDLDIRFRHGLALQRLGRMTEAAAAYEAVLAADPGRAGAHANLAAVLAAEGDYDAAEAHFRQADEGGDGSAATRINLATMLHAGGRLDRAAAAFEDVLAEAPDTAEAFIPLSAIVHAHGDPARASRLLHEGVARKPHRTFLCIGTPAATVMTLRGLQNSHYGLGKDGETVMTGGNFPISNFLSNARFTNHVYHLLDGNLCAAGAQLPPHEVIVNTIADADLEPESLRVVADYCEAHPEVPVINRPEAVMETTRDAAYRALKDLPGIVFPATVRTILPAADSADFVRGLMESCGLEFPLLVRRVGTHTGISLTRVDKAAHLSDGIAPFAGEEVYLIQYVDTSDAEGVFRKMRAYLIDGEPYPAHCFLNSKWAVHIESRTAFMRGNPDAIDEERRFMTDLDAYLGGTRMGQLRDTAAAIAIDFVGVDFTLDRDGQLFIFEYNPIMRHGFDFVDEFPHLEEPLRRLSSAFDDMVERAAKADAR